MAIYAKIPPGRDVVAGLFKGRVRQLPPGQCSEIASICGYEIRRRIGADISDESWMAIRRMVEA